MFEKLVNLYQKQDFKQILEMTDDESVNDIRVKELRGIAALNMARFEVAVEEFSDLAAISPSPSVFYHLGLSYMKLNNLREAIAAFTKNLSANNQFTTPSKLNLAYCYKLLKQTEKAIEILSELIKFHPQLNQAWFIMHEIYRNENFINELEALINITPSALNESPEIIKSKAHLYFYKGDYEKVISLSVHARQIFPNLLAMSFQKLGKFNQSVEVYREILNETKSALNFYNLAAAYSNLTAENDLLSALENSDKCLQIKPDYHKAFYCKSLVYQKLRISNKALDNIELALMIDKNNTEYLYSKAEILYESGKGNRALEVLDEILKINDNTQKANRLKGIVLLQQNDASESEKFLSRAIEENNTDQRAIAYYSISKIAQGRVRELSEFLGTGGFVKEYLLNPVPEYDSLNSFNRDFENDIRNHTLLRREPNGLAARNGYMTDDLFHDKTRSIMLFRKMLMEKINEYIEQLPNDEKHYMLRHQSTDYDINSWATWVKGDGFIDKHIHEESWISGAYYCKIPEITNHSDKWQGYFEYGCIPDDIQIPIEKEKGYIKPLEGKLIIFPSYLYHQTIKHDTDEDRMSVAFDLTPRNWLR